MKSQSEIFNLPKLVIANWPELVCNFLEEWIALNLGDVRVRNRSEMIISLVKRLDKMLSQQSILIFLLVTLTIPLSNKNQEMEVFLNKRICLIMDHKQDLENNTI